ncbi:MAG TPA: hypothetical protein ENG66_05130 [Thermococcus sp.]|nr:MAG: hypothetical protein DRP04_06280 [Archaeoglobales archaeon]HDH44756.1 hypothetical protein [Thermococcus sp.]
MGVPEEKIEELDLTPAYAEASRRVETYDYSKLPNAKPYIFMEGRVNCYTESDWNYDVERLVCYGEAQIDSSAHLPSVMDDLRNIVDKAIEVASDEWHSTFIEKVKEALARKIIAR